MRVGGSKSQNRQIELGVHTGVLSATFSLVAIKGILRELGNGESGSLFVDNQTIYITIRNQRVAARALQGVTNKLNAWAAERGLTFSNSKTVSMVFRKKKKEK